FAPPVLGPRVRCAERQRGPYRCAAHAAGDDELAAEAPHALAHAADSDSELDGVAARVDDVFRRHAVAGILDLEDHHGRAAFQTNRHPRAPGGRGGVWEA